MKLGFLITARLKSTRLPKKLLIKMGGRKIIEHVIDRVKLVAGIDQIILCTSRDPEDDPLVSICELEGISHFRGSADDVLQRLLAASQENNIDHFIGITGENALFSVQHASEMSQRIRSEDPDYCYLKGLPIGCGTYGASIKALELVCKIKEMIDTEIWGYLLNRPEIFEVIEIPVHGADARPGLRITLDHPEDEKFFRALFERLPEELRYDHRTLMGILELEPQLLELHGHLKQADLSQEVKDHIEKMFVERKGEILAEKQKIYGK